MHDKVTALIPTYRRPEWLRRAILSVLRQTHGNLQVSVFDDASGDGTEEVIRNLSADDKRIKYHRHENNIGALSNFKFAFNSVDTPYFSVLSNDDFLAKDLYENALNVLNNNPEVMFVILNTLPVDEHANLLGNRVSTNRLNIYCDQDRLDALHSGVPTTWTAMVFRKEVAQIYVDMDDRYDVGHDLRFLSYAAARYDFAYLSKVGAFVTYHAGSISASRNNFDLVHHAVQISRYVEIFHDENVPQCIKDRAAFYLRRLLSNDFVKPATIGALKRMIKNCCNGTEFDNKIVEEDIENSRYAGYAKTSIVLNFLHYNKFARNIIRASFSRCYKKRIVRRQSEMLALQNGIYKKLFEEIKEISTCCSGANGCWTSGLNTGR